MNLIIGMPMKHTRIPLLVTLLAFSALLLASTACNHIAETTPTSQKTVLSGEYILNTIEGEPYRPEIPLVLTIKEDRISGRGPVNNWSAAIQGNQIGLIMSTKMAGPPELMKEEHRLLTALQNATVEITPEGQLHIHKDNQVVVSATAITAN